MQKSFGGIPKPWEFSLGGGGERQAVDVSISPLKTPIKSPPPPPLSSSLSWKLNQNVILSLDWMFIHCDNIFIYRRSGYIQDEVTASNVFLREAKLSRDMFKTFIKK